MASSSSSLPLIPHGSRSRLTTAISFLLCYLAVQRVECYTSIFNFGDSITDTGNFLHSLGGRPSNIRMLPYGETFFGRPTGRFSDGRLVIDFIAAALGTPLLPPYLAPQDGKAEDDQRQGVNFAFAGATALDVTFLKERGILTLGNYSLGVQIGWFKDHLRRSVCRNKSDCKKALNHSLLMVSMQGNDYNYALGGGSDKLHRLMPPFISLLSSSVKELVDLGATTIVASGMLPIGCLTSAVLSYGNGGNISCVGWINDVVKEHNLELQRELGKIRELHPDVNILYADFYGATIPIYDSPARFGFSDGPFKVCCGSDGGSLNYNDASDSCIFGEAKKSCDDPSTCVSWDGVHLTEAAYKIMAEALLQRSCNFSMESLTPCPYSNDDVPGILDQPHQVESGGKSKVR